MVFPESILVSRLVANKQRVIVLLILFGILLFISIEHALRYSSYDDSWWFGSADSCQRIVEFYTFSLLIINSTRIGVPKIYDVSHRASEHAALRMVVISKLLFGIVYLTCLSFILFPVLCFYGYNWVYLISAYLYVLGFGSLCLLPVNILWETKGAACGSAVSAGHFLHVLLFIPVIGAFMLMVELFDKRTPYMLAAVLTAVAVLSVLIYKIAYSWLIGRYQK